MSCIRPCSLFSYKNANLCKVALKSSDASKPLSILVNCQETNVTNWLAVSWRQQEKHEVFFMLSMVNISQQWSVSKSRHFTFSTISTWESMHNFKLMTTVLAVSFYTVQYTYCYSCWIMAHSGTAYISWPRRWEEIKALDGMQERDSFSPQWLWCQNDPQIYLQPKWCQHSHKCREYKSAKRFVICSHKWSCGSKRHFALQDSQWNHTIPRKTCAPWGACIPLGLWFVGWLRQYISSKTPSYCMLHVWNALMQAFRMRSWTCDKS